MTTPSLRAHLLRATHEWLTDNGHTPYVQVLVDRFVQVPVEYVRDNSIVLNVSYDSTNKLQIGEQWVEFQARFNGQVRSIMFPVDHVVGLFSKETQEGYQPMTGEEFQTILAGQYQLPEALLDAQPAEPAQADEAAAPSPAAEPERKTPAFTRVK